MDALRFQKLHPREFHRKFLEAGVRPDGRGAMTVRKTLVTPAAISSADGSALAKVGNTTVLCGLKLEIGSPSALAPKQGGLVVDVRMAPLASPGHSKQAAQSGGFISNGNALDKELKSISRVISQVISSSEMLNLDELCIKEGDAVWVVYVDCLCIDYSGNVLDAALLAVVAALGNLKLPATEIVDSTAGAGATSAAASEILISASGSTSNLVLSCRPVPLTFGLLDEVIFQFPHPH